MLKKIKFRLGDALLIIDVQNDFLPGGNLAVTSGYEIIPRINNWIQSFESQHLPIFLTRDWHPETHCSFLAHKGIWSPHCIKNTFGAEFPENLHVPKSAYIISKATEIETDAYSAFEDTDLHTQLKALKISRVFVSGLATEYCVLHTVKDALKLGYAVYVFQDAIAGINAQPDDSKNAVIEMKRLGAVFF